MQSNESFYYFSFISLEEDLQRQDGGGRMSLEIPLFTKLIKVSHIIFIFNFVILYILSLN